MLGVKSNQAEEFVKADITGYSFEPWHYRFVGRYHASEMHRLDMCLEEYIAYLGENE